jgi:hypothetical protein
MNINCKLPAGALAGPGNGLAARHRTRAAGARMLALAIVFGCAGCATIQPPQRNHLDSADPQVADCARWFEALDLAVARSGVADIAARRMAGFPYLRIDRFLASLKDDAKTDPRVRQAWLEELRARDVDGRRVEIANLPDAQIGALGAGNRDELVTRTQECASRLLAVDTVDAAAVDALYRHAYVADDYSSLKRALGLYELTRLPFYAGVRRWQDRETQSIELARRGESLSGRLLRYVPADTPVYSRREVGAILARAAARPLGLPRLSATERNRLFATYAPLLEVETSGDYDRIGRLVWSSAAVPQVDVTQPVVYRKLGYTRAGGRTLLQLVYVAWMPERPRQGPFDLLGGHLDGIVWRVTLTPDGEPVLFDSIHPCGCYQMFFPTPRLEPVPAPRQWMEWAFVPATLPAPAESERLVVTLQTRTHYLRNVWPGEFTGGRVYEFADYDELRSLPLPRGGSRSLFGADGLVAGTERGERFLFWPMGIRSPGAMRQSGSQATAFVGRRHFDDADLLEKRFRFRDRTTTVEDR